MRKLIFSNGIEGLIVDAREELRSNKDITQICIHRSSSYCSDVEEALDGDISAAGLTRVQCLSWPDVGELARSTLHILPSFDGALLSKSLIGFLDHPHAIVASPITDRHVSRVPIVALSIPKSGTHLMLKLLEEFGIRSSVGSAAKAGKWGFLNNANAHSTVEQVFSSFNWPADRNTNPFFRSACVFIYRHPLDVVVSESRYFSRPDVSPFSFVFGSMDEETRIDALINGPIGTISGRVLSYWGWLKCANVAPVSYEELVGAEGGGSRDIQLQVIWALQLKLQVAGSPERFAERIYDEQSPTFHTGKIGKYKEVLTKAQKNDAERMNQNSHFLDKFGYTMDGNATSSLAYTLQRRELTIG